MYFSLRVDFFMKRERKIYPRLHIWKSQRRKRTSRRRRHAVILRRSGDRRPVMLPTLRPSADGWRHSSAIGHHVVDGYEGIKGGMQGDNYNGDDDETVMATSTGRRVDDRVDGAGQSQ